MLYLKALRDESLLGIGPLWQTVIPHYSDGYRLLHADPYEALTWMTNKVHDIRARGWYETPGETPQIPQRRQSNGDLPHVSYEPLQWRLLLW